MAALSSASPSPGIDDTVLLQCGIESQQKIEDHVEYVLKVTRGLGQEQSWSIIKRYSDFDQLYATIQAQFPGRELPMPPKRIFGNFDRDFIAERRRGLQAFVDAVLVDPVFSSLYEVKNFFDPKTYPSDFSEEALREASMYFRSEPRWEITEPLKRFGWRLRKHYFVVQPKTGNAQVLSWTEVGPDCAFRREDIGSILKHTLPNIKHPYIYPTVYADLKGSGLAIRAFTERGSLRDVIYRTKPKKPYMRKYYDGPGRPLDEKFIRKNGREILEALKFLSDNGFPYSHLHAGNVLIDEGVCRLTDLENGLLGVVSRHKQNIVTLRKIVGQDAENAYLFGLLLYEMAFGREMEGFSVDALPAECPPGLRPILEMLVTVTAVKTGMPSLATLLSNAYFADAQPGQPSTPEAAKVSFKVKDRAKEMLKAARDAQEKRMAEEQKRSSAFRRLSRMSKKDKGGNSEDEKASGKPKKKKTASAAPATTIAAPNLTSFAAPTPAAPPAPAPAAAAPPPAPQPSAAPPPPQPARAPAAPVPPAAPKAPAAPAPPAPPAAPKAPPAPPAAPKAPPPPPAMGGPPPPPPPMGGGPPPPPPPSAGPPAGAETKGRGALLSSITGFKGGLKKVKTNDRSAPSL